VTALANSAGVLQASYKYDPYGRYLGGSGTLAGANLMRFSSKPWVGFAGSTTAGLYYYGYRFYDPYLQRWVNRDPHNELGFGNLLIPEVVYEADNDESEDTSDKDANTQPYTFVFNSPPGWIDPVGLQGADSVSRAACRPDAAGQIAREHLLDVLKARQRQLLEQQARKTAEKAAKILAKKVKKAEKLMRTDKRFSDWVHREIKPRLPKETGKNTNRNLTPEELVEAMEYYFGM
jgi:RHS repeat-associated protein